MEKVTITLAKEPMNGKRYTIRLFFNEPENKKAGERVFDVYVQDKRVLKNFDIIKEAGEQNHLVVKEFKKIKPDKDIVISFSPITSSEKGVPVISGIEVVAEK